MKKSYNKIIPYCNKCRYVLLDDSGAPFESDDYRSECIIESPKIIRRNVVKLGYQYHKCWSVGYYCADWRMRNEGKGK